MRRSIAAPMAALAVGLLASQAHAQNGVRGLLSGDRGKAAAKAQAPAQPRAQTPQAKAAGQPKQDKQVFPANAALPAPVPLDQVGPANIQLPTDPIEPYLLTRDHGPFMILAHTFRGPEADRYALALVLELRREHGLEAFVCRIHDIPMRSRVFGVPPTAPEFVRQPQVTMPEKVRTFDEAGVMVGHAKTIQDADKLLKRVKKIHPTCLEEMPTVFSWRKGNGLKRAMITTNPYVPAETLFPRKKDPLLKQMNAGPRSLVNAPGNYSLQIAEFSGRSTFDPKGDQKFQGTGIFKSSPLATAAAEAEELANALAKDPEVQKTGYQPYVYHDRYSSKVTLGAFQAADDPAAARLREKMLKMAVDLNNRRVTDKMIVPAAMVPVEKLED